MVILNNVKTTEQYKNQRHWIQGNLMSTKNRTAEQQPATSAFLTKWLNKLTSLLSKKGQEFLQPGSLKPAVGD